MILKTKKADFKNQTRILKIALSKKESFYECTLIFFIRNSTLTLPKSQETPVLGKCNFILIMEFFSIF